MPSYTQICCWRFLRARRSSTKFFTGNETLDKVEKTSCTSCINFLISFNYLALYAVVIVPFVLISMREDITEIESEGVTYSCEDSPELCELEELEARAAFNNFVLMINGGFLIFSMLCETIIICIILKPTGTKCNSYLICQLLTGLTMRAVILISAQLIAVFI